MNDIPCFILDIDLLAFDMGIVFNQILKLESWQKVSHFYLNWRNETVLICMNWQWLYLFRISYDPFLFILI
jgi:hypothetical protein